MLSQRPWRLDLVLQFVAMVLFGYGTGSVLMVGLLSDRLPFALNKDYVMIIGGTLSFQGVILLLLPWLLRQHGLNLEGAFGISSARVGRALGIGLVVGIVVLPMTLLVSQVSVALLEACGVEGAKEAQTTVKMLQENPSLTLRILVFIAAVILAPVAEEVIFRGLLYPSIKQLGYPKLALWGTSILFGIIHLNLMTALPLALLAVILTLLYEATDDLLCPIVTHMVFNLMNFLYLVFSSGV